MQGTPVADPSGIYYVPDSQPWCSRHHDGQYADRTYGGYLEGVVSTAREKDDYRRVAVFHGSTCSVTDCKVRISYAGIIPGSKDPFLFHRVRRCQLHDVYAS